MSFLDHPAHRAAELVGDGYTIIDVREPQELSNGALPDSSNIPLSELPRRISSFPLNAKIAVICQSGARSTQAAHTLKALGYQNVANLVGGMNGARARSYGN